ncbi:uncharacterized protein [Triticum aestivum]|uniref:uncharacterized protein isoform X2 n=1 Tax=Triticum aestivum TaxID=4565 RepID=UPI001D0345F1|nr:uncharacterized protein LOC123045235 isoform X2 [Triticum aestivum]
MPCTRSVQPVHLFNLDACGSPTRTSVVYDRAVGSQASSWLKVGFHVEQQETRDHLRHHWSHEGCQKMMVNCGSTSLALSSTSRSKKPFICIHLRQEHCFDIRNSHEGDWTNCKKKSSVLQTAPTAHMDYFLRSSSSGQIPTHLIVETYTWPATNCAASRSSLGMTW